MAEEQFILTPAGYAHIQAEIRALEAEQAQQRAALSDVEDERDNMEGKEAGAFFEAKTSLEHSDERIGHLRYVLERAEIRTEDADPKRLDPGERAVVWDLDGHRELTFDLLSAPEVQMSYARDDGGRGIAVDSPVGRALVGRQVGDVVRVEAPDGLMRYAIRRIEEISG